MTIFTLDYAVLLIAFLIVAYNVLKTPDDENQNSGCSVMKMAKRTAFSRR